MRRKKAKVMVTLYQVLCKLSGLLLTVLMLIAFQPGTYAQTKKTIAGNVVSSTDLSPIPGANVVIKGTAIGTITDFDGNFKIDATSEDVLVISFIGYNNVETKIGDQTYINVKLEEDIAKLDEVVVVGYGTMKRTDLSSAQVSISSEDLKKSTVTSIDQALQGRAAGVYVTQNSGAPGGGVSVNIRGINSISGNTEPMYVIDGIQFVIDDNDHTNILNGINPDDIDAINILQGPAATSIYGSRAGNGVVVITTKKGKAGETQIQYNMNMSYQTEPKYLPTLNLRQYAEYYNEYNEVTGGWPRLEFADPSLLGDGTNWQKELFQPAPMQKHQLSLNGGSEKTTFYLSAEYFDQEGVAYGSGFSRFSTRLNIENKTREWFLIGMKLSLSQTDEKKTFADEGRGGNVIETAISQSPDIPVKNPDGTWGGPIGDVTYLLTNPIGLATINKHNIKKRLALINFYNEITIIKGLKFRTEINSNVQYENEREFEPPYKFGDFEVSPLQAKNEIIAKNNYSWLLLNQLQFDKIFGLHSISLMGGHEAQETGYEELKGVRYNYVNNAIEELAAGDATTASNDSKSNTWAMESVFGRLNYVLNDRYIFMATVRRDGSTNFGANKRWGTFPSATLAYRLSEESFMKSIDQITNLKIRVEAGITGNQAADKYAYLARLTPTATTWGTGFRTSNYPNPDLQWEETKQINFGIDLGMYKNRIELVFDIYKKSIDQLLMEQPLPAIMGSFSGDRAVGQINPPWVNIGAMENKGFSITLNTVNMERPFTWQSGLTFTYDRNKLTKLYNETANLFKKHDGGFLQQSEIGEPLWQFYIYKNEGLFQDMEDLTSHAYQRTDSVIDPVSGSWVGDIKFEDYNNDGVIDEKDRQYLGNPFPKFSGGLSNTFKYKNIELYIFINGVYGNDIYNYLRYRNESLNSGPSWNKLEGAFDFARITTDGNGYPILENPGTKIQRITSNDPNGNNRANDYYIEDGSYLKVKTIQLSYTISEKMLNSIKFNAVNNIRLSIGIQNAFTFTKYTGYDPEIGQAKRDNSDTKYIGIDIGRYPQTRTYTFNLQANF